MEHTLNAAILSLIGLITGALLQFLFTRHLESKRHQRELRTKAYTDYLNCVSEHANSGVQRQSVEGRALSARTADAKCRICLYGSASAVEAFATFERLGATMGTEEQCEAFTEMVFLMRSDSAGGGKVALQDLRTVLLGSKRHAT
jgi:hypothetical protein